MLFLYLVVGRAVIFIGKTRVVSTRVCGKLVKDMVMENCLLKMEGKRLNVLNFVSISSTYPCVCDFIVTTEVILRGIKCGGKAYMWMHLMVLNMM